MTLRSYQRSCADKGPLLPASFCYPSALLLYAINECSRALRKVNLLIWPRGLPDKAA